MAITTKNSAARTGRNLPLTGGPPTFKTLSHAVFTKFTAWAMTSDAVSLSFGVARVCLVEWTVGTTGRGNLDGVLSAGWVSPDDLLRLRLDGCMMSGGGVCGRSLLRPSSVVEVAGTDLVRRTPEVEETRVRSMDRRWTSGETDGHLLRAPLRPTSVPLLYTGLTSVGRHGDRLRVTAD